MMTLKHTNSILQGIFLDCVSNILPFLKFLPFVICLKMAVSGLADKHLISHQGGYNAVPHSMGHDLVPHPTLAPTQSSHTHILHLGAF